MIGWVRCVQCHLQHTRRLDGCCPRCGAATDPAAAGALHALPTVLVAPEDEPGAPPPPSTAAPPTPSAAPRVWTVFVAFLVSQGAAVAGAVAVLVIGMALAAARGRPISPASVQQLTVDPGILLAMVGLGSLSTAAVALVAGGVGAEPLRSRLGLGRPRALGIAAVVTCGGGLGMALAFDALTTALRLRGSEPLRMLSRAIQAGAGTDDRAWRLFLLGTVAIAVLAPVGEEFLYRGYMQRRLVQRWGASAGVGVTAVLFGLAHVDRLQSPFALVLGLLVGWVTVRSGSILPALLGHVAVNGWAMVATRLRLSPESPGACAVVGLLGLALLAGAVAVGRARLGAAARSGAGAAAGQPAPPVVPS
jgi:membrane protease YdiL (CAAX protease family)